MNEEIGLAAGVADNDARAAFEGLNPVLREMEEGRLIPLRYTATEAVVRGLWVARSAQRDVHNFEDVYQRPPVEEIGSLRTRTLAIKGAELAQQAEVAQLIPPDFVRVRVLRKNCLAVERAVFLSDAEIQAKLDEIEKGSGHRDLGDDGIELADIAKQNWPRIEPTGLVTMAQVDELEQLSADVLQWAGRRQGQGQPKSAQREMEQRAWTYMAEAYNKIRDHAYMLFRDNPDLWKRDYPSLYASKPPQ